MNTLEKKLVFGELRRLMDFESAEPDWQNSPYAEFANYPSVKWKLLNLSKLKKSNPSKLEENVDKLKSIFGM